MSYRPQVKQNGGMQDLPLDAETVKGRNVTQELDNIKTFYAHGLKFDINNSTFVITATLTDGEGNTLSSEKIDLPLESVVVDGEFNAQNDTIVLTLQNGNTIDIPVGDLIDGLASQTEIDDLSETVETNSTNITNLDSNVQKIINGTTPAGTAEVANSVHSAGIGSNTNINNYYGADYWGKEYYFGGGNNPQGSPEGISGGHLSVIRAGASTTIQVIRTGVGSDFSGLPTTYQRNWNGSVWTDWEEIVTADGSYPTLGAGYLAKNAKIVAFSDTVGWWKIGTLNVQDLGNPSRSSSTIFLVNGLYPHNNPSGLLELKGRIQAGSINAAAVTLKILSGNLSSNDHCIAIDGDIITLYGHLDGQYMSEIYTILQDSSEGAAQINANLFTFDAEFYGTSAPSGAVYAVNRNRAAQADNDGKGQNIANTYIDKSNYQNDITGVKVFSSVGLRDGGRFRTWDGGKNNDTLPENGGYELGQTGLWYYPGASLSESYYIQWSSGANNKKKLVIDDEGLASSDNSNAVATTKWVTDKLSNTSANTKVYRHEISINGTISIAPALWLRPTISVPVATNFGVSIDITVRNNSSAAINSVEKLFSNGHTHTGRIITNSVKLGTSSTTRIFEGTVSVTENVASSITIKVNGVIGCADIVAEEILFMFLNGTISSTTITDNVTELSY